MKPLSRFLAILLSAIFAFVAVGLLGTYVYNLASEDKDVTAVKPESQSSIRTAFQDYNVYIEDAVRYILANAHPEYAYFDVENAELSSKTENKIDDIAGKIDDISQPRYKLALTQLSTTGSKYEKKYSTRLLQIYNELELDITSVQQDEQYDFVYHFKEGNSRVHFTTGLSVLLYCTPDVWDLKRYTEYLETGVFKDAPDASYSIENINDENKEIVEEYDEGVSEQETPQLTSSTPYKVTSNDEVFAYFREIMGKQFTQKDIQYLESKYAPLIPTESHVSSGEYTDEEDKLIVRAEKKVIIDMLSYHYNVPQFVGEYFADADFSNDYYRHLNASRVCYAYDLCQALIEEGRFNTFYKNFKREEYSFEVVDINKLKYVQSQQERKICEVLNEFVRTEIGNGGIDGFCIFADYFDFIEYNPYRGWCSFLGKEDYELYANE